MADTNNEWNYTGFIKELNSLIVNNEKTLEQADYDGEDIISLINATEGMDKTGGIFGDGNSIRKLLFPLNYKIIKYFYDKVEDYILNNNGIITGVFIEIRKNIIEVYFYKHYLQQAQNYVNNLDATGYLKYLQEQKPVSFNNDETEKYLSSEKIIEVIDSLITNKQKVPIVLDKEHLENYEHVIEHGCICGIHLYKDDIDDNIVTLRETNSTYIRNNKNNLQEILNKAIMSLRLVIDKGIDPLRYNKVALEIISNKNETNLPVGGSSITLPFALLYYLKIKNITPNGFIAVNGEVKDYKINRIGSAEDKVLVCENYGIFVLFLPYENCVELKETGDFSDFKRCELSGLEYITNNRIRVYPANEENNSDLKQSMERMASFIEKFNEKNPETIPQTSNEQDKSIYNQNNINSHKENNSSVSDNTAYTTTKNKAVKPLIIIFSVIVLALISILIINSNNRPETSIVFEDPVFESLIRLDTNTEGQDIYEYDLLKLDKKLDYSNRGITNLKGIEYLKNIEYIDLSGNKIKDISTLKLLSNLKFVNIENNSLSINCNTEKGLNNRNTILTMLMNGVEVQYIHGNSDKAVLIPDPVLNAMIVSEVIKYKPETNYDCYITKEDALLVKKLDVNNYAGAYNYLPKHIIKVYEMLGYDDVTTIISLAGINQLNNLKTADFSNNLITSLEPLSKLHNLEYLNLRNNSITDITQVIKIIESNPELKSLFIKHNNNLPVKNRVLINTIKDREIVSDTF